MELFWVKNSCMFNSTSWNCSYMLMADLGAEVIKIETPGKGDNNRNSGFLEGEIDHFLRLITEELKV